MGEPTFQPSTRDIDARSIVTLIIFFIVNILVIWPLGIPIGRPLTNLGRSILTKLRLRSPIPPTSEKPLQKSWHAPLSLETAPVIGVLLLLASTCIPGSVIKDGIVGNGGIKPYDILTLFLSFAYISISLDCTGLLRYLAFKVANSSGKSGRTLYFGFYTFFAVLGLIVGNDPIILSGTPFLVYFTGHAGITTPTAYLFTEFQTSNLVSALLVSSNPTNLVLTSAFGVSFLGYSAWLALPVVAGVVVLFPVLRWGMFRSEKLVPRTLNPPKTRARDALVDPFGAIFGAVLFGITIIVLIGLSAGGKLEGVEGVWTITAPAAICMLIRDIIHDLLRTTTPKKEEIEGEKETSTRSLGPGEETDSENPSSSTATQTREETSSPNRTIFSRLSRRFPTPCTVISKLPLPLIPFAFSMFILVEALNYTGWIKVFAVWWGAWEKVGGVAGSVWLMGVLGVVGCNIFGTNIGATILLSRVLQQWQATTEVVSDRSLYGAVFALAISSNYGAYSFVFSASLAGLLWRDILKQKNLVVTQWEFIRWNTVPMVVTMIVSCLVVAGEVCVMYKT